jgi:ankyrin repeat protein
VRAPEKQLRKTRIKSIFLTKQACKLLDRCSFCGNVEMARFLYAFIGPEESDRRERAYDIITACKLGDLERINAIAETSKKFSINKGRVSTFGKVEYPLECACRHPWNPELLTHLVNSLGANLEILSERGYKSTVALWTPLQSAIAAGDVELTKFLLELGAKAPWEDERREGNDKKIATAADVLTEAAKGGGSDMLRFLLDPVNDCEAKTKRARYFDVNGLNKSGQTPLNIACIHCSMPNVQFLLDHGALPDANDVQFACRDCDENLLAILMDHGASVSLKNVMTLDYAKDKQCVTFLKHLHSLGVDVIAPFEELDGEGGDVKTTTTKQVRWALHEATSAKAVACIEYVPSFFPFPLFLPSFFPSFPRGMISSCLSSFLNTFPSFLGPFLL